ncbi:MAG: hypothetical protein M1826_000572 [Phylliscum demangeonii]|nr:MAG: hypothetical protein M1826_000572 [Phylliscum demangeonii]
METANVHDTVERLASPEDAIRKRAAFGLQTRIGDPSFADVFIAEGGLSQLRHLALHATGNTLAYSLTSLSKLLEVDKGWNEVDEALVERVVELVVHHPLVNILRGAMSILVAVVSHAPPGPASSPAAPGPFGFRALKPAIGVHPEFLEMLVNRLSSADHALCANSLQLINSLMRDAVTHESEAEWPKFIKRLQDLGLIKAVYVLMQSSAVQDLAPPLLEFQALTKVLLRKWRDVAVDQDKPEHRRAIKGLHLASNPARHDPPDPAEDGRKARSHNPEKWRRLGFASESPAAEFDDVGFLGLMDLADFVRRGEDGYQKLLLEHATQPPEQRCPIAQASLAVTAILYEHFEVDKADGEDGKSRALALDARTPFDHRFRPLLLQWSRLHTTALQAFFRLWKTTAATAPDDVAKIEDLVRILLELVVGQAPRTTDIRAVEDELAQVDVRRLRQRQMQLLEMTYEDAWGHHLRQVRDELQHEARQFVQEQRIRCLLQGHWFPRALEYRSERGGGNGGSGPGPVTRHDLLPRPVASGWRFVRLSHNRRHLHYAEYDERGDHDPGLELLPEKIDLTIVASVDSNLPRSSPSTTDLLSASAASASLPPTTGPTTLRITIHGPRHDALPDPLESPSLLTLYPPSASIASEWLDGLRMLLPLLTPDPPPAQAQPKPQPQAPPPPLALALTPDTQHLVRLIADYGLHIRLLNVRFEDAVYAAEPPPVPGRDGLDAEYYYDVVGAL